MSRSISVLFVCLGNICRSPTAHAVFRSKVKEAGLQDQIVVDSAGTGSWHIGEPPDARSTEVAEQNGYDMSEIFARQVCTEDFDKFDYILAMDKENHNVLQRLKTESGSVILDYFMSFSKRTKRFDVPDPYFGTEGGFDHVLELIEGASDGLLDHVRQQLKPPF
ncbi:MAG: low molecular weight phosphotyrosine protein phosphatase [Proteobacteria bacterium]|jgi:protein-tyrosine phosphatase|nr:low molecular weight phosphotyrosine protein phosphatase [Pseudomonadota bacterium]